MQILMMILLVALIVCAVVVSFIKSLTASVIVFGSFSLIVAVIWMLLESPDLAITEAAVGAGVTGLLFYATLKKIGSIDDLDPVGSPGEEVKGGLQGKNE